MDITEPRYGQLRKARRTSIKRAFDIIVSFVLLLAMSPLLLALACLVCGTSKGPAFFCHKRVGRGGKEFYLYKFRTMVQGAESLKCHFTAEQQAEFMATYKLQNDPRVTPIGRILRKTSLDELPQFFNVLMGDMSIVGPRPVTKEELSKYGVYTDMLFSVNPGITGLWQVSGRNDVSYEDRVHLDMQYVNQFGLLMDCKIFFRTFRILASRLGAY